MRVSAAVQGAAFAVAEPCDVTVAVAEAAHLRSLDPKGIGCAVDWDAWDDPGLRPVWIDKA